MHVFVGNHMFRKTFAKMQSSKINTKSENLLHQALKKNSYFRDSCIANKFKMQPTQTLNVRFIYIFAYLFFYIVLQLNFQIIEVN